MEYREINSFTHVLHKLDLSYSFSTLQKYQFADQQQSQDGSLIINYSVFIQLQFHIKMYRRR